MRTCRLERRSLRSSLDQRMRSSAPWQSVDFVAVAAARTRAIWAFVFLCLALASMRAIGAAPAFQVSNVDAQPSGAVALTVAVPNWSVADPPRFSLNVGDNTVPASDVKRLEQPPLSVILCIDKSGSMRAPAMGAIKQGVRQLFQNPPPKVDVAMIGFGSTTKSLANFGTPAAQQADLVQGIQLEGRDSKTALYEAVQGAIAQLKPRTGLKRIIVITDGEDEGSAVTLDQVIKTGSAAGIGVDVISTGPFSARGEPAMERLSGGTQGVLVKVPNGTSVGPALEDLVDRARKMGGTFQVAFQYKPAANQPPLEEATLALVAPGGERGTEPVRARFVPVATAAAPVVADKDKGKEKDKPADGLSLNTKILIGLGAGALAAILLVFLVFRKRKPEPVTAPPPVEPRADVPVRPAPAPERSTRIVRYTFPPPEPGRPTAILKGRSGIIGNLSFNIEKPLFKIGAAEGSDLRVTNDDYVSNDHAIIRYDSGSLYLADRGSRNGTFLNGARLAQTPLPLSVGDQIRFGHSEVTVEATDGAAAPQAENRVGEGSVR